jgi:hypothetical protein
MSLRNDAIEAAERVADGAVTAVIEAIRDSIKDRRDNAFWWHIYFAERWRQLPRIRWIARLHCLRQANRFAAMVRADRALAAVCGAALRKL